MRHTATLRLFNAIQTENKNKRHGDTDILGMTIKNGYILDPAINPTSDILNEIESIVGISGEKANQAFHKSWAIIQDTPQEALWTQALVHYITTYGYENMGMFREDTVYIPHEKLELPEMKSDLPLTVIKAMTEGEILKGIIGLGASGIALSQETLDDIMAIVKDNEFESVWFIGTIKNRELQALLYDYWGIVPSEPVEFLRHLISKLTDESLLIKNDYLIGKIKESDGKFLDELLKKAPADLASIFYRFKPLFLAMKSISNNRSFFNRLRKVAVKLHKPMPEDYLNNVTCRIKHGKLDLDELNRKLEGASIFRKIRLANALKFRENSGNSILYRVRNGRGWATDFKWHGDVEAAIGVVTASIVDSVAENIKGKTIYIPSNVHYTLPATEKQFTGFLPMGSYIAVPEDMIVGVHWYDTDHYIDLDLSVIGVSGKTGWDSIYKSEENQVLFSGDMTTAPKPKGASEFFYLKKGTQEPKIVMLNFFNFRGDEVEAKIIVAHDKPSNFDKSYMVDVSNIIASANVNINKKQNILGLIVNEGGENRFYFANVSIGNSITSSANDQAKHVRQYYVKNLMSLLGLGSIFIAAGAKIVHEKPEGDFIDLSPEALNKTTIIDLIKDNG